MVFFYVQVSPAPCKSALAEKDEKMEKGYFGDFGGQFVPEELILPLKELEKACDEIVSSRKFKDELKDLLEKYAGRPTPLSLCTNLSKELGFNVWLKREDLLHTGAHKINNTLGQCLLAKYMGKKKVIAETGAGQHGVATAAAAARLGLQCTIYMGATDVKRQSINVSRMKLMGAEVVPVVRESSSLKDAIDEAMEVWISDLGTTTYCFGTAAGPHPFPTLVRDLQSVIGKEAKKQIQENTGSMPDAIIACVGGGSNAIGLFHPFASDPEAEKVRIIGIESGGTGVPNGPNSAPINLGSEGVLHGQKSLILQDEEGKVLPSYSIAAGLDYPGVGAEHAHLFKTKRAEYRIVYDADAMKALETLCRKEGILPALESSHALAFPLKHSDEFKKGSNIIVNLSGRGDKDIDIIQDYFSKNEIKN